jgi:hypothetical protein
VFIPQQDVPYQATRNSISGKVRGHFHPITCYEGTEGKYKYNSTLFKLGARWGWVINATTRPIYPWDRRGTHCIGTLVGPRDGLDWCRKYHSTGIRSSDPSICSESLKRIRHPGGRTSSKGQDSLKKAMIRAREVEPPQALNRLTCKSSLLYADLYNLKAGAAIR